jgi:hypothetical protein
LLCVSLATDRVIPSRFCIGSYKARSHITDLLTQTLNL